jgi:hypothetical protein
VRPQASHPLSGSSLSLAVNGSWPAADHMLAATERIDKLKEEDIIMVGADRTPTTTTTTTTMKTDLLSDSQLTIFKVKSFRLYEVLATFTVYDDFDDDIFLHPHAIAFVPRNNLIF